MLKMYHGIWGVPLRPVAIQKLDDCTRVDLRDSSTGGGLGCQDPERDEPNDSKGGPRETHHHSDGLEVSLSAAGYAQRA